MYRKFFLFCLLLLFVLTSCTIPKPSTINPEVLPTKTPPAAPEAGKATITGQVTHKDGSFFSDVVVRLAEVARGKEGKGGAFILDVARSPSTYTDAQGNFVIQNITPGEYVVVVGNVEIPQLYEIIQESNGDAKVYNFPADQVTDVGTLSVSVTIPTLVPTTTGEAYPSPGTNPNATPYPAP